MKKITMTALSVAVTVIFLGAAKAAPVKTQGCLKMRFRRCLRLGWIIEMLPVEHRSDKNRQAFTNQV